MTVKGCLLQGQFSLASFHGNWEERGWVLGWGRLLRWSVSRSASYGGEVAPQEAKVMEGVDSF